MVLIITPLQSKLMQKEFVIHIVDKEGRKLNMEVRQRHAGIKKRKVKTWTSEEDNYLIELYTQMPKKWTEIAAKMADRNENQCLHRFRRLSQLGSNHKIWSGEQDEIICKLIRKHGKNWKLLSEILGTKNGKQIRERFINKLDPQIKKQEWTVAEDMKIIQLYSRVGSRWSQISKHLSGRPQNKIKNRFYSFIQKNYDVKIKASENMHTTVIAIQCSRNSIEMRQLQETQRLGFPSIGEIEIDARGVQGHSQYNLLESVARVDQEWRAAHLQTSVVEMNSNDLFYRFNNS